MILEPPDRPGRRRSPTTSCARSDAAPRELLRDRDLPGVRPSSPNAGGRRPERRIESRPFGRSARSAWPTWRRWPTSPTGCSLTIALAAKEGIALLNSGAFSTSLAALALADATAARRRARRRRRSRPRGVRREPDDPPPASRRDAARTRASSRRVERLTRAARRQLPVGRGRGPQPAGSAHLPLCRRRCTARCATCSTFARRAVGDRAQRVAGQPARRRPPRTGSCRSRTSTSCRSPPPWTSCGSASRRRDAAACERSVKLLQAHLTGLPEGLAPRSGLAENSLVRVRRARCRRSRPRPGSSPSPCRTSSSRRRTPRGSRTG